MINRCGIYTDRIQGWLVGTTTKGQETLSNVLHQYHHRRHDPYRSRSHLRMVLYPEIQQKLEKDLDMGTAAQAM